MKIQFLLFAFLFVNSYAFAQTKSGYTNNRVQKNDSEKFDRDQTKREIAYYIKRCQENIDSPYNKVTIRYYEFHIALGSNTAYLLPKFSSCLTEMGYRQKKIDTLNYDQSKTAPAIAFGYDEEDSCFSVVFGIRHDHLK